jgi:peptide/nickel transport system substrate-binding protein
MSGVTRLAIIALALSVLAAACISRDEADLENETQLASARRQEIPVGGTLVVGSRTEGDSRLDPQLEYQSEGWELLRCCLLRTLLSYSNLPVQEGGTDAIPDLAAAPPSVSRDGREWMFRLRPGLHYAPPLEDVEITARDFLRALEREAKFGTYSDYYSIIEGFDRFAAGEADSISGLEARDDHTLVVHVTEPVGHVAHVFTLPATAPIPPNPYTPGAELGVAQGHGKRYGRYLVASGPYMVRGAEDIDFSLPPNERDPSSGYSPGRRLILVRNPSWKGEADPLRPAYVDRIDLKLGDSRFQTAAVDEGTIDLLLDHPHPTRQVQSFETDQNLANRVLHLPASGVWYLPLNVAQPPFDDVHVRKAVNFVVNKRRVIEGSATQAFGHGHLGLDLIEANLLLDYDPFRTPGGTGDLARAKAEMSLSRYDSDGDGICDHRACRDVEAWTLREPLLDTSPHLAQWMKHDFRPLGIDLRVRSANNVDFYFTRLSRPRAHVPIGLPSGYLWDFPNGAGYFSPLLGGEHLGERCCNYSVVGASPEQLRRWGYATKKVPDVDAKLKECTRLIGDPQTRCWAELDILVMERVVPWIPLYTTQSNRIVSDRVVNHGVDSLTTYPALDHFAVEDG